MIINVKFVKLNTSTINMAYNSEILSDQRLIRNPVRFVFLSDSHFFPDPVPADLDTPYRNIHEGSNLFCGDIHFEESTEPELCRGE